MKNTGFPPPRIDDRGQVQWTAGLFMTLFLAVMMCAALQIETFKAASDYLEDALAASNLASALIDIEEYGISNRLEIADPVEACGRYQEALKENLGLDADWECANKGLISGRVRVEAYIVYNVQGDEVCAYVFAPDGSMGEQRGLLGEARAPNGLLIESTGIYSEISFPMQGFLGIAVNARKGKLVDIKSDRS